MFNSFTKRNLPILHVLNFITMTFMFFVAIVRLPMVQTVWYRKIIHNAVVLNTLKIYIL